jgi:hypothetical protein
LHEELAAIEHDFPEFIKKFRLLLNSIDKLKSTCNILNEKRAIEKRIGRRYKG